MIEVKEFDSQLDRLLESAYSIPGVDDEVSNALVKLVKDGHENDIPIAKGWRKRKAELSARQLADLITSDNIWTNVLTYATFPKECDGRWIDSLKEKVEGLQKPLPSERFAALLRDLDDDQFDVREKASKELIGTGARARKQVEDALRAPRSAEVKQRLERILDTLKRCEPSPQAKRVVGYLGNLKTPESKTILKLLAAGDADPRLAKAAKAALDRDSEKSAGKP